MKKKRLSNGPQDIKAAKSLASSLWAYYGKENVYWDL